MIGQTISHYKIVEKLGEGGMGVVYKAHDTKLDRFVALKFLPHYLTSNDVERARFLQEAKAASALNHPNVCTIYGIEEHDNEQFIVMEFIDGKTLRIHITHPTAQIPFSQVVDWASQIGEALSAAHEKEITHRDIKPENIMVNTKNQIKVMDFGLAKLKGGLGLTRPQSTLGTTAYMSPEQMQSADVDHRTDIWSFGIVLYEMLAGRLPFRGEHQAAMVYSITNEDPQPILSFRHDVPHSLKAVLAKALAKDKSRRYENVQQILSDLRQPQRAISIRKQEKSIAVLPLTNMSASADDEYFSDGMTEDIIAQLSKIRGLKVISRTSVMQYKRTQKSVREIGTELGVSHLLEGSVRKSGNRLRIVAQLIDARTDQHLWAETYDRDLTDVFAIQTEIAENVKGALKARLTNDERSLIAKKPTENMEAYNFYLLGRYYYNQWDAAQPFVKAIEYFQRAIDQDRGFARAYAALALPYLWHGAGYYGICPRDAYANVSTLATRALELDDELAEAHAVLAMFEQNIRFNWEAARSHIERALELNPNSAEAYLIYGWCLPSVNRMDEAVAAALRAIDLDPASATVRGWAIYNMLLARRPEQALETLRAAEAQMPDDVFLLNIKTFVLIFLGRAKEAVPLAREVAKRLPVTAYRSTLAWVLAAAGEHVEARELLNDIQALEKTEYVFPTSIAVTLAQLGEMDRAFEYLERAYEDRAGWMSHVGCSPAFDVFRGDPRFESLVRRIGAITATWSISENEG